MEKTMKTLSILTTIAILIATSVAMPPANADGKKPAKSAPTADSVSRDLKALEDLLSHHEKDSKMATDADYVAKLCKRLREMYDARAAEIKDLWADLAGSMIQNNYGNPSDKNTKIQMDAKFHNLEKLEKRLKAVQERIDKLCPCPPNMKFDVKKLLEDAKKSPPPPLPPPSRK